MATKWLLRIVKKKRLLCWLELHILVFEICNFKHVHFCHKQNIQVLSVDDTFGSYSLAWIFIIREVRFIILLDITLLWL